MAVPSTVEPAPPPPDVKTRRTHRLFGHIKEKDAYCTRGAFLRSAPSYSRDAISTLIGPGVVAPRSVAGKALNMTFSAFALIWLSAYTAQARPGKPPEQRPQWNVAPHLPPTGAACRTT